MYKLDIAYQSNKGGRDRNQDYVAFCTNDENSCLVACDGLGSYSGSEIISQICCDSLVSLFKTDVESGATDTYEVEHCRDNAIKTQREIIETKSRLPDLSSACTTMACVITNLDKSLLMHIGDTRIYFFRHGRILFQTRDHSLAQYAVDRGEIQLGEVRSHRDQNKLTRVMGSDYYIPPDIDIYDEPLDPGDAFVLCTDGFWEYVYESELEELLGSGMNSENILTELIDIVNMRAPKNNDNFSAIVARVVDTDQDAVREELEELEEVVIPAPVENEQKTEFFDGFDEADKSETENPFDKGFDGNADSPDEKAENSEISTENDGNNSDENGDNDADGN